MFAGLIWMPGMLATAVSALSGLSLSRAAFVAALPHLVWATLVARTMFRQVEHLL